LYEFWTQTLINSEGFYLDADGSGKIAGSPKGGPDSSYKQFGCLMKHPPWFLSSVGRARGCLVYFNRIIPV
jgi:hypothetical protein